MMIGRGGRQTVPDGYRMPRFCAGMPVPVEVLPYETGG